MNRNMIKYINVEGRHLNVFKYDTLQENREMILNNPDSSAIEIEKSNGEKVILPVISNETKIDKPGYYPNVGSVDFFRFPYSEHERAQFEKYPILDFSNIEEMQDNLECMAVYNESSNRLLELEEDDNVTIPPLKESDTPTMRVLKEAIIAKNIDIDKYKGRFGDKNFPNDKRKLNEDNVTLFMMERFCDCLDMEMDIVVRDKPGNIANPMNMVITANIFPGNGNNITKIHCDSTQIAERKITKPVIIIDVEAKEIE